MSQPKKRARENGSEGLKRRDLKEGLYVTKLSPAVIAKIVAAIGGGATLDTAAAFAGIHRSSFNRWQREGRNALELDLADEESALKAALVFEIDKALSEYKLGLTTQIRVHGQGTSETPGQWTALAWLAERRWPDEFGRRQRIDHANADGQPLQMMVGPRLDLSKLSEEDLADFIRIAEKATPDALGGSLRRPEPLALPPGQIIEGAAEIVSDEPEGTPRS